MKKLSLCGLILVATLAGLASSPGEEGDRDRRNALRERQLLTLINEKIDADARNTNLFETDDLAYDDVGSLRGDTLTGLSDNRVIFRKDVASGGKTGTRAVSYRYRLLYLPETEAMSLQVVRVMEHVTEKTTHQMSFEGSLRDTTETLEQEQSVALEDLLALEHTGAGKDILAELRRLIIILERKEKVHALRGTGTGNLPNGPEHISAESNRDYIRFARVNDRHPFADLGRTDRPVSLEATFSSLTLSHKRLYLGSESIGIHGFGFEAGFGDRVLNLVAFQSPVLTWGLRFLVFFNDARGSLIDSSFFLDMKIMARSPVNTASFINKWRLHAASPVMSLDRPKLNVSPGATFEIATGSPYNRLPFVTFMYSGGAKNYQDPNIVFGPEGAHSAYFSTRQWEADLSFFWNVDRAMYNRFRLDVGAGTYDVWEVRYDSSGKTAHETKLRAMSQVHPLLQVHFTHESNRARFGARARFFDNRLTFVPWFKVFETGPHEIRLEAVLMPRPIGRSSRVWEVDRGNLVQIRYRFGFDKNL